MPILERQGTKLFYADAGSGRPPLLFVHGFAGDHRHFAPQLAHFAARHRVVAVDRRGHGASDKPAEQRYTVPAFADDLAWTCRELGLHRPVVVVHSMGVIGLELAARFPEIASALVLLDAPLVQPPPVRQAFEGALAGMRTPAWQDVIRGFADQVAFRPGDTSARKAAIVAGMCATPQPVVVSSWESFLAYDPAPAAAAVTVPMLLVRASMPGDPAAERALLPRAQVAELTGTGHFCHLEAPDQVNTLIERFLADVALTQARPEVRP
jgi:pimeloyl-ACP methyl ester carboxylesterase